MVNTEAFIKRLEKILAYYGLSASAFADTVGVQRSSISHLLSGRNKPSLEFVLKVVHSYPEVDLYWLLNGKGSFPPTAGKENPVASSASDKGDRDIDKIIIFYKDGSFESFDKNRDTDS